MGVDCDFIAENKNRITMADIEKDVATGKFPGGTGRLIEKKLSMGTWQAPSYFSPERPTSPSPGCSIQIINDLVVVSDSCRISSKDAERDGRLKDYQRLMIGYLRAKCGGKTGLFADVSDITLDFDTAEKITAAIGREQRGRTDWWQPEDFKD